MLQSLPGGSIQSGWAQDLWRQQAWDIGDGSNETEHSGIETYEDL